MIEVKNNICHCEGTAKELTKEFTQVLIGIHNSFVKEFGITSEEAKQVIGKCAEIAFMNEEDRAEMLSKIYEV